MKPGDFRTFAHLLPVPYLLVSGEGEILGANPAAEKLTGRDRSEIEGARLSELVSDDEEELRSYLSSASRTGGPLVGSFTLSVGEGIACSCLGGLVQPADGETPVRIMLRFEERESGSDRFRLLNDQVERLTREVKNRHRLEQEQARLQALLEESQRSARVGSWEWDVRMGELTWSEELYRIYGLDPEEDEITYERYQELLHPEDREEARTIIAWSMESGEPFAFDHRIVRDDGEVRVLHGRGRVVRDPDGGVVRMIGSGQDITERKRSEDGARFLVEAGHILASSLDYEETLRRVAELAVPRISDWAAVDVLQEGEIRRLVVAHPDPAKRELAEEVSRRWPSAYDDPAGVGRVLQTGEPLFIPEIPDSFLEEAAKSEEHLAILRGLNPRSLMVLPMVARGQMLGSITFASAESGRTFGDHDFNLAEELSNHAALAVDNALLYAKAQAASRARDEVIAIVSHDLRSSLHAVLGGASLLLERSLSKEKREDRYRAIKRSAERMERLTRDLLDITRIEAGQCSVDFQAEDASPLIEEALDAALFAAKEAGVALSAEVPPGVPPVWVDRRRILQVLDNLLSNAIRYTPRRGGITVGAAMAGDDVRFRVSDTGVGISSELRDHVFDRYYQVERAGHGGAGLGLPIVKGIIEAHRGEIWLESEVGRGTTFFFTLPAASRQDRNGGSPGGGERVASPGPTPKRGPPQDRGRRSGRGDFGSHAR